MTQGPDNAEPLDKKKLLLEELRQGYSVVWDNKNSLDEKAMKLITVSSIIGAIIFGFSSIIFSNGSTIDLFNNTNKILITSNVIFSSIIVSIMLAIVSIIFSLKAISLRNYIFVVGGEEDKVKLDNRLKKVYLEKYWNTGVNLEKTIYDFMGDYIDAIAFNFSNNQIKGKDIIYSLYCLVASIASVAISLILIMINLIQ